MLSAIAVNHLIKVLVLDIILSNTYTKFSTSLEKSIFFIVDKVKFKII